MILQVLSIIFMSKVHIDKAAFDIRVFFWERENIFLLFCARVPLFDTGLWDALEGNAVRGPCAAAKVGHCPKQIHFWNYWIHACASVYALAESMALDPEKCRVVKWPVYCRLLQEAFRSVVGLCHLPRSVCASHKTHTWQKGQCWLHQDSFVQGMLPGFAPTCTSHWNKHWNNPASRVLQEKKSEAGCSAVAEFLLPLWVYSVDSLGPSLSPEQSCTFFYENDK